MTAQSIPCLPLITALHYQEYAQRIWNSKQPLTGKRIFIRLRQELDEMTPLSDEVAAVVPKPEQHPRRRKSPIPFEAPS